MTKVYTNAEIRSRAAAIRRLEAGEEFVHRATTAGAARRNPVRIFYDKSKLFKGQSPFRCDNDSLDGLWPFYRDWEVASEPSWQDSLSPSNKVLCWCSDSKMHKPVLMLVHKYEPEGRRFPFQSEDTTWWKYAEPAKTYEVEDFYVV